MQTEQNPHRAARRNCTVQLNGFRVRYTCRSRELLKQYRTVRLLTAVIHVAVLPDFEVFW